MALSATKPHCALLREERIDEFNVMAKSQVPDLGQGQPAQRGSAPGPPQTGRPPRRSPSGGAGPCARVDLSEARLDGASLHHAQVGGVLFPPNLPAEEIRLSVQLGTRLRCVNDEKRTP
ncbi:MAG: hypothetical protein Q9Q13_06700 [Acidobacteriota bacterium]|nr:hypothetical protein [Acidobacteriota bacterium]